MKDSTYVSTEQETAETSTSLVMPSDTKEASLVASFLLHLSEILDDDDIVKKF